MVIAENEGITLSPEHWEVVRFVRDFYLEFNTSPAIRMLVKAMANKFGEEKGNSRYLYRLFPKGPAKQATKIAGLPKYTRPSEAHSLALEATHRNSLGEVLLDKAVQHQHRHHHNH